MHIYYRLSWQRGGRAYQHCREYGVMHRFPCLVEAMRHACESVGEHADGVFSAMESQVEYFDQRGAWRYRVTSGAFEYEGTPEAFRRGCDIVRLQLHPCKSRRNQYIMRGYIYAYPGYRYIGLAPIVMVNAWGVEAGPEDEVARILNEKEERNGICYPSRRVGLCVF